MKAESGITTLKLDSTGVSTLLTTLLETKVVENRCVMSDLKCIDCIEGF